jgi:hypothetical protein
VWITLIKLRYVPVQMVFSGAFIHREGHGLIADEIIEVTEGS